MKEVKLKIRGMESVKVFSQQAEKLTDLTITKTALEGYRTNGWVHRCIEIIQSQVAAPPWIVVDSKGVTIPNHAVATTINFPSTQVTRTQMFNTFVAWLELVGVAPHSFTAPVAGRGARSISMISPDRIKASIAKTGVDIYQGFEVDLNGTGSFVKSSDFDLENVVMPRYLDPANPGLGVGTLLAASLAVDQDNEQSKWNIRLMQNRGRVEDVFISEAPLDKKQGDEIRDSIFEKIRGRLRAKIGMPLVLGSGMKYKRMGLDAKEVDFINSQKFNREKIFGVFGVPVQLGGSQEASTFNNFNSAMRVLWEMKIFDVLNTFRDVWNLFFLNAGELKEGEFLTYDTSRITALRDDEDAKAKTAGEYFQIGVPVSQINDKLKLGFDQYPGWELPFNGKILNPVTVNTGQDSDRSQRNYFELRQDEDRDIADESKLIESVSDDEIEPVMLKNLRASEASVFDLFDKGKFSRDDVERSVKEPQDADFFEDLTRSMFNVAKTVGDTVVLRSSYKIDKRQESELDETIEALLQREAGILKEISFINAGTVDSIMLQVRDFLENHKTLQQLKDAIQDAGIADPIRSLRIARTIGVNAASIGQVASATEAGAESKTWMIAGNQTRDIHDSRSGEQVSMTSRFSIQSGSIGPRWPGDVDVTAEDRINCRCFLSFS